ncbi:hypothetical protein D9M69_672640 [compost metagenome]
MGGLTSASGGAVRPGIRSTSGSGNAGGVGRACTPFEETDLVKLTLAVQVDHSHWYYAGLVGCIGALQYLFHIDVHTVVIIDG